MWDNSRGHAKVWASITPTRGAMPKRGMEFTVIHVCYHLHTNMNNGTYAHWWSSIGLKSTGSNGVQKLLWLPPTLELRGKALHPVSAQRHVHYPVPLSENLDPTKCRLSPI